MTHLRRRSVAESRDEPLLVVSLLEGEQRVAQLLDRREVADPEELLLERPKEALDAAVAFGLPHKRRRGRHAEKRDLGLEVATEIDAAVVVPDREPVSDRGGETAEVVTDALAQRLEGFEAIAVVRRMNPDALGGAVIDRREDSAASSRIGVRPRRPVAGCAHRTRCA